MPEARVKTAAIRVIPVAGSAGLATGTLQSRGIVLRVRVRGQQVACVGP